MERTSMPTLEIALLATEPGQEDPFATAMSSAAAIIARQRGCSRVELLQCVEQPETFRLVVSWDSVEAHEQFRVSEAFGTYRSLVQHLFTQAPTYQHWNSVHEIDS
jgi:heme-degrading monooxygenase HmoA